MRQVQPSRAHWISAYLRNLWRPAIVAIVLLFSAALAYRQPSRQLAFMLLALVPAIGALVIYLRQPAIGLLALIVAAMMVPFSIGTGTNTTLNSVVLFVPVLTGLWIVDMGLRRRAISFHRHNTVYWLLALIATAFLSFIVNQLSWFDISGAGAAAQIGGLMVFVISAAAFLVAAHTLNEQWLSRLVYLFTALGTLIILGQLIPPLGRLLSMLVKSGAYGSVFWIWLVALPTGLALFHQKLAPRARLLLLAVALLTLLVGFFRGGAWASGWAPPLVAFLILIWFRFPRWGWIALFVATLIFIVEFDRFWLLATTNESWLTRRQAWQIVLDTVAVNPLLGLGPSNYYFYVQRATIMGWGGVWNVTFSSHNNWIDLLAQTGIIGLILFVAFMISIARMGWRLYNTLPFGFARGYAAACVAGLIATLISGVLGDWFLPFVYNIGLEGMRSSILFWVFLGGLLMLHMAHESPAAG